MLRLLQPGITGTLNLAQHDSIIFQYIIRAPRAGVVDTVPYTVGTTVPKGARLVHLQKETDN